REVGAAGGDEVEGLGDDGADEVDGAVEQVGGGVGRADRDGPLHHDVAGVQLLVHHVRGDADLLLAVDEGPDDGGEARVGGQQRVVDVQRAAAGEAEDLRRDPGAPVVGDDEVGIGLLEAAH